MLSPFLGALEVQVCHLSATRVRHGGRSFDASAGAVRRRHRVVPSGGLHCDALRHAFKLDLPCSYPLPRFDFTIFVTEEETETVTESPSQVGTCVIRCDTKKDRCTLVGPRADSRPTFAVHITHASPHSARRQITPKTSRYTRCSSSMSPNVSINGRIRSSGRRPSAATALVQHRRDHGILRNQRRFQVAN